MLVGIIDWREMRRDKMHGWLSDQSVTVKSASTRRTFGPKQAIDLLLLHVGESQNDEGDDLQAIVNEFSGESWIVAYSGTVRAIKEFDKINAEGFVVFPHPVSADSFDEDFKRVVAKVLRDLPSRRLLPATSLKETVTGFDATLERKLEVLVSVLKRQLPSVEKLQSTNVVVPTEMIDLTNPRGSSEKLRKYFFGS